MYFRQALDFMLSFPDWERGTTSARGQIMTLHSVKSLLSRLDNPHHRRKTVHVTGSKGKGSTSTMLASILTAAGNRTALFTSPHLHSYTEQIAFDLYPVSEMDFATGMSAIRQAVADEHDSDLGPVSTFGVLVALFFELCRKRAVDWQIVEVGLGGRDDATNVFEHKELAVITPISLEHTAILGYTTSEIAANKAAIITSGCTAILAPQPDRAVKVVVAERCAEVGARLIDVGDLYRTEVLERDLLKQKVRITGQRGSQEIQLAMLGDHQIVNASTAFAAAQALIERGMAIDPESILAGLSGANVPGRFELLRADPIVIADGAHNDESTKALAQTISAYYPERRCIVVLGVNADKDIDSICGNIATIARLVIATRSQSSRAMEPALVAQACESAGIATAITDSVEQAVRQALQLATSNDLVCITGSLYVVAESRTALVLKPAIV